MYTKIVWNAHEIHKFGEQYRRPHLPRNHGANKERCERKKCKFEPQGRQKSTPLRSRTGDETMNVQTVILLVIWTQLWRHDNPQYTWVRTEGSKLRPARHTAFEAWTQYYEGRHAPDKVARKNSATTRRTLTNLLEKSDQHLWVYIGIRT
jgi:hypothetical protein